MEPRYYMSIREVMHKTGWSERTTRAVAHRKDAPIIKIGPRIYFHRELFDDYCEKLAREQAQLNE